MPITVDQKIKDLLGDELISKINEVAKDAKIVLAPQEDYIPKSRFDEVNNQTKELKARNEAFEKQVADALKAAKTGEEFKANYENLSREHEAQKSKYEAQIQEIRTTTMLSEGLRSAGAINPKTIMPLLDVSKIKVEGDKLVGLEEQIQTIRKNDAYLFEVVTPQRAGRQSGGAGGGGDDFDAKLRQAAGLPPKK